MLYSIFSTLSPSIFPRFISFEIHTHTHFSLISFFKFYRSIYPLPNFLNFYPIPSPLPLSYPPFRFTLTTTLPSFI